MDKTQRVDLKNGVNCLVIMFTPRVMVMKMSKNGSFLYFLLSEKNQSQFEQNIYWHLKDLI